jgi:hypothetical protein
MFSILLLLGASAAHADDGQPAKTPSHADPATQTLPAAASATAQKNAFGQQGARERAAHQAAKAAASDQAKQAAAAHKPADAGTPNSHASSHAAGASASNHAQAGIDRAQTASGGRVHTH